MREGVGGGAWELEHSSNNHKSTHSRRAMFITHTKRESAPLPHPHSPEPVSETYIHKESVSEGRGRGKGREVLSENALKTFFFFRSSSLSGVLFVCLLVRLLIYVDSWLFVYLLFLSFIFI